jgi:hypothetical protein
MASGTKGVSTQPEWRPVIERGWRRASIDVEWPGAKDASASLLRRGGNINAKGTPTDRASLRSAEHKA